MRTMPEWSRMQIVQALKVVNVEQKQEHLQLELEDPEFGPVYVSHTEAERLRPEPGGYMIIDDFSRLNYMPGWEFESKFRRIPT